MQCFVLLTRPELEDTNALFRAACVARDIECIEITPGHAGKSTLGTDRTRLIYRAAADWNARVLEKLIARPNDVLLHDPHFVCEHQPIRLAQSGIPMARAIYVPDRTNLATQANWLGGFPVVVKRPGSEGGAGVSLALDPGDLAKQLDTPDAAGAMLEAYVPHRLCWRLTVLAGQLITASASEPPEGDFRTNVAGGRVVSEATLPGGAADIAIRAVAALNLEFAGVDVMEGADGSLMVAEVNFPCYFADQQARLQVDIAGAIVDRLSAKAG